MAFPLLDYPTPYYLQILTIILVLFASAGLLYWINTNFNHKKYKNILLVCLWGFSAFFFYKIVDEFWFAPKKFESAKNIRYLQVIKKFTDIRDTQLAYKSIKGKYQNNWDSLIKFIELDSFILTEKKDSTVLDLEKTKLYNGVKMYNNIVITKNLDTVSVKDLLFGNDDRYKKMMYVYINPSTNKTYDWAKSKSITSKFELKAGLLPKGDDLFPVFEVRVHKDSILFDQNEDLLAQEKLVKSVDGVDGEFLIVGSMDEVKENGNWPKNYTKDQ